MPATIFSIETQNPDLFISARQGTNQIRLSIQNSTIPISIYITGAGISISYSDGTIISHTRPSKITEPAEHK